MQSRRGRPKSYEGVKEDKRLTITKEGWEGARQAIKDAGFKSVSHYLEEVGRGNVAINPLNKGDKLE